MRKARYQIFKVHITHIMPNLMVFFLVFLKLYCFALCFSLFSHFYILVLLLLHFGTL